MKECKHQGEPQYKRCDCNIWFQSEQHGAMRQQKWSSGESNWERAEAKARQFDIAIANCLDISIRANREMTVAALTTVLAGLEDGVGIASGITLVDAIAKFLEHKEHNVDRKRKIAPDSLYRYRVVLTSLAEFCAGKGILLVRDVTFSAVKAWTYTWNLEAQAAKRGRQEKVRNFIKFCLTHAPDATAKDSILSTNPIAAWESIKLDRKEDSEVSEDRIIRPKVLAKILKAVDEVEMTPENRVRVKACMKLQLEAGLAIVDAVMLHKDELVEEKGRYRVKTARQKTGNKVNNIISTELAKTLLKVKNGNPEYFFWSGATVAEDAPSYFQKLYRKVFAQAGVEHSSHDLRHTFAAYFLEAGNSTELLSQALGHGDIGITQRYYSHFTKKRQNALDEANAKTLAAMSGD